MASSLAQQLAQVAAKSKTSLDAKTLKAAHAKSLIFEPRAAAGQTFPEIFTICHEGFEELCRLDCRFTHYGATLFSEQSQDADRVQMSAEENGALDKRIEAFLHLVGGRLRLMPAIKAIEWLIRRFRYVMVLFLAYISPDNAVGYTSSTRRAYSRLSCHTTPSRHS
jgi:U3 small nucleolar RNA-associated protein 10